ncbi:MAG: hypothetical protein ACK5U8_12015, partial [Deltaproteobacteria bacterium]
MALARSSTSVARDPEDRLSNQEEGHVRIAAALGAVVFWLAAAVACAQPAPRVHVEVSGDCVEPLRVQSFLTERTRADAVVWIEVECGSEVQARIRVEADRGASERT